MPKSESKIIGFHGKAGWFLDAIGVHLQPIPKENNPLSKMLLHSHQNISHGDKKLEYSVIQGSVGQSFDIVVALKQKVSPLPSSESQDYKGAEITKHKVISRLLFNTFKKHSVFFLIYTGYLDKKQYQICCYQLGTDTEKLQPKAEGGGAKTYGPWGGTGGIMFDDGIYTGIRQINLSRSVGIMSIKICYDFRGQAVWGSKHGGTGGFRHDKVCIF